MCWLKHDWVHLDGSSRDEEPLVDGTINGRGREVLILGDGRELASLDAVG